MVSYDFMFILIKNSPLGKNNSLFCLLRNASIRFYRLSEVLHQNVRKLRKCAQVSDFDWCRFCFHGQKEELKTFFMFVKVHFILHLLPKIEQLHTPFHCQHFSLCRYFSYIQFHTLHTWYIHPLFTALLIPASVSLSLHLSVLFICPLPLSL